MACRLIYNRQGVEVESKTWNQILQEVEGNETIADRLYGQLASPNFLAWFGDYIDNPDLASIMTNELGEPRLLYHASTKKFNNFDLAFSKEVGFHFGTEQSAIERHFPGGLSGISLSSKIKEGVNEIFKEYSELAKIGTEQQYSQYLDTIFPDSKVKDIVYHGITSRIKEKFDKFSKEFIKSGQGRYGENGFFFSENKEEVNKNYNNSGLISAVINLKNTNSDIYKNTWKETVEYLTEPQEIGRAHV